MSSQRDPASGARACPGGQPPTSHLSIPSLLLALPRLAREREGPSPHPALEKLSKAFGGTSRCHLSLPQNVSGNDLAIPIPEMPAHNECAEPAYRYLVVQNPDPSRVFRVAEALLTFASEVFIQAPSATHGDLQSLPAPHELTVADLCEAYVRHFRNLLGFSCCSIWLWDDSHERLGMVASVGYEEPFCNHWYARGQTAITLSIATAGIPVYGERGSLENRSDYSGRCEKFIKNGFWNLIGLPLMVNGRIVGALKFENKGNEDNHLLVAEEDVRVAGQLCECFLARYSNVEASFLKYRSDAMKDLLRRCHGLIDAADQPILLSGPEGTGKQAVASYIHLRSLQGPRPFKVITCCEPLRDRPLSREIANYIAQSRFANGNGEFKQLFKEATGGTVYFDGITGLSHEAQAGFSRLIECLREQYRIRVIASVPGDPNDLVVDGGLHGSIPALFVGSTATIPPLRERADDVELLAREFGELLHFRKGMGISPASIRQQAEELAIEFGDFLQTLKPGERGPEVRELRAIVERACLSPRGDNGNPTRTMKDVFVALFAQGERRRPSKRFAQLTQTEKEELVRTVWEEKMNRERWTGEQVARYVGIRQRTLQKYLSLLGLRSPRTRDQAHEKKERHSHVAE